MVLEIAEIVPSVSEESYLRDCFVAWAPRNDKREGAPRNDKREGAPRNDKRESFSQ